MHTGRIGYCVVVAIGHGVGAAQPPAMKVVVADAEMRSLPATTRLVATVEPMVRATLGSEVAGLVVAMPGREGDRIKAGGIVCRLNDDTLSAELDAAQAKLRTLEARLAELEAGTRSEELTRLNALYEEAKALHQKWTAEKERVESLQRLGSGNEKEVYDTEAEYAAATQRMIAAQAVYEQGVAGPRKEVVAQARFAVAEQKAVVKQAESDLSKTVIRAPFTGYVVRRETEVGQWVQRGGPVVEMIDLSSVLVTADAPEAAFPHVHVGDRARVMVDAIGEEFVGVVRHVIPQAEATARTFPVQIEIENAGGKLKGGMIAWSTVTAGPATEVAAVPKDAVNIRGGTPHVCIIVPGEHGPTAIPTPVTTGADIDDWVAVTSGNIAPKTQVVIRGNERVYFPMPVEISNAPKEE